MQKFKAMQEESYIYPHYNMVAIAAPMIIIPHSKVQINLSTKVRIKRHGAYFLIPVLEQVILDTSDMLGYTIAMSEAFSKFIHTVEKVKAFCKLTDKDTIAQDQQEEEVRLVEYLKNN